MLVRRLWAITVVTIATAGCTSILGDFSVEPDATADASAGGIDGASTDGSLEGTSADRSLESASADGSLDVRAIDVDVDGGAIDAMGDGGPDGNSPLDATLDHGLTADAACGAGATLCDGGCVALDASIHCGACGHDCHGGSCTAAKCGAYVIAQQPTTGAVAKLATDGRHVLWSDTGIVAIEQTAATGGPAIALAPASTTSGAVGSELALAGSTVAFSYLGSGGPPSVGLATVDMANSGNSVTPGAVAVNGVSLNTAATHVFFVNISGTQGSLNDCPVSGGTVGACVGVGGGGRFLAQTAADSLYMFFNLTAGATTEQPGLYIATIATRATTIFLTDNAQSVANDGSWAYWTEMNDGASTYAIFRTLESAPGTVLQTVVGTIASSAFATDGVNVYYWTGSAVASKPVSGGAETVLAQASGFTQIAVGGGLLVWTDGATIWGLVLPGH
jgi:hypothetical protein